MKPHRRPYRTTAKRWLKSVQRSPAFVSFVSRLAYGLLRFVYRTQEMLIARPTARESLVEAHPAIVGMWHGQHLLAPLFRPKDLPYVALLSKSADAEINARVVEHFGIETVRGSGGRERGAANRKGGARALLSLLRALEDGKGVTMIADVPKGTPREAGRGIVTLARLSGRPVLPSAAVTSRRYVLKKTWDATTLPLPFGRVAVVIGDPIHVPRDLDEATFEAKRREITLAIEDANRRAMALADATAPARALPEPPR